MYRCMDPNMPNMVPKGPGRILRSGAHPNIVYHNLSGHIDQAELPQANLGKGAQHRKVIRGHRAHLLAIRSWYLMLKNFSVRTFFVKILNRKRSGSNQCNPTSHARISGSN